MKEKFEIDEEDVDLDNLYYKVGNTSGMDVTSEVPSALAERVGQTAQRGGGEMEIQIENPSSFHLDREPLYNVVEQLGLDVSFHSDPNVGYTSAYRTGQGRGYNPTHQYFSQYLQEFASFKEEKDARGLEFNISRINPHISTDELPALEERMAQDVSVDPFGIPSSDFSPETVEERNRLKSNFYRNKAFLEDLYYTLYRRESRFPFEQYSVFAGYSEDFNRIWKEARHKACFQIFISETEEMDRFERIRSKALLSETITMSDRAVSDNWKDIVDEVKFRETLVIPGEEGDPEDLRQAFLDQMDVESLDQLPPEERERIEHALEGLEDQELAGLSDLSQFLPRGLDIKELGRVTDYLRKMGERREITESQNSNARKIILEAIEEAFNELWRPPAGEHEAEYYDDVNDAHISIDGKMTGLQRRLEVQQLRIVELAYDIGLNDSYSVNGYNLDIDGAAAKVFAGDKDFYGRRDNKSQEKLHRDLLRRVLESQRFERLLRMESVIFYQILPAWMRNSNSEWRFDGEVVHRRYEAPEFIWHVFIGSNWGLDFENWEDWQRYFNLLENNKDFQRDVASASAALYVWGHFTQRETNFQLDGNNHVEQDYGEYTWIEWMDKYGIGVNLEAMQGSPQQEFKLWKPSHMVAACHAINITARKNLDDINPELYGRPVKFTIDMEHTSSFGVDPWKEMEELIEQEKDLAESDWGVEIDEDRPLADMVRMYHLTKPGQETTQGTGHLHGPFRFGDKQLYTWLYELVQNGFAQSEERASVMYEIGGDQTGTVQKAKLSMNMIELGITPEELDPSMVDPGKNYENEKEALIARFFRMDRPHYSREWSKIEQHAFDPLKGLLEASEFEYTFTSSAALDRGKQREFPDEEYR